MHRLRNVERAAPLFVQTGLQGVVPQNHERKSQDAAGIHGGGVQAVEGIAESQPRQTVGSGAVDHVRGGGSGGPQATTLFCQCQNRLDPPGSQADGTTLRSKRGPRTRPPEFSQRIHRNAAAPIRQGNDQRRPQTPAHRIRHVPGIFLHSGRVCPAIAGRQRNRKLLENSGRRRGIRFRLGVEQVRLRQRRRRSSSAIVGTRKKEASSPQAQEKEQKQKRRRRFRGLCGYRDGTDAHQRFRPGPRGRGGIRSFRE
mmetsp:Transcript_24060/g.49533  ORF Transcript_24060/g.49533 Transcript_24060/m.49533 type:complete len:255 (+) Transcript_24060:1119-1883(+)